MTLEKRALRLAMKLEWFGYATASEQDVRDITSALAEVRNETLEEAAKKAEELSEPWQGGEISSLEQGMGRLIAKGIRKLKK